MNKPHLRYYGGFWRCALPGPFGRANALFPWGHGATFSIAYNNWTALMRLHKRSLPPTLRIADSA